MGLDPLRFFGRQAFYPLSALLILFLAASVPAQQNSADSAAGGGNPNGGPETISETVPIPVLNKNGGIFGRAQKTGVTAGLIEGKGRGLSPEDQSEILRQMFEGDQTGAGRHLANRQPGASALPATGRMDANALVYPAYALSDDLKRLEKAFSQENFPAQNSYLKKAAQALSDFEQTALSTRSSSRITPDFLKELGLKQKEAERRITICLLALEISETEREKRFMTPALAFRISAAPEDFRARQNYLRAGQELSRRLVFARSKEAKAWDLLLSSSWIKNLDEIKRALAESRSLDSHLAGDILRYRALPFLLTEACAKTGDEAKCAELKQDFIQEGLKASKTPGIGRKNTESEP